jgi:hypothetical protein
MHINFCAYKNPIFGRGGNNTEKRGFQKRDLFLEKKETQGGFGIPSQFEFVQICKLKYLLSRGQIIGKHSVPAQKTRGLLDSSPSNVGIYFQPRAFVEFPEDRRSPKLLGGRCQAIVRQSMGTP